MAGQFNTVSDHIVKRIAHTLTQADYPLSTPLVVAFSGGVDSTVLLHAAVAFREQYDCPLHAVHVHHGLSPNADAWARHCELECRINDVTFHQHEVTVESGARKSVEAEARKARYKVLLEVCQQVDAALLLGQHAEDQLETVLLQLKRGAGPQGLAAMGEAQLRQGTLVLRPMLALEKKDIIGFAREEALSWVEDESNSHNSFDRNFLRNEIIPHLLTRWPQLTKTVGRSASLCAQQTELVNQTAQEYLLESMHTERQLSGEYLSSLTPAWQSAVVRCWFSRQGQLPPSKAQTDEILSMLEAKHDATPEVRFQWGMVSRFNGDLYWVTHQLEKPASSLSLIPGKAHFLPWLEGSIWVSVMDHQDSDKVSLQTNVRNLKVKPEHEHVSKTLKDWFKVWRVPRWERNGVPVIFFNDQPIALIVEGKCKYVIPRESRISVEFEPKAAESCRTL